MKKIIVALIALLAVFTVFVTSSEAKVMEFEHFSIDVPRGWRVEEDKENTVSFFAPGDTAALTVSIMESGGVHLSTWAGILMKKLNGRNLEQKGDVYSFQFRSEGIASRATVAADDMIIFMTVIGEHRDINRMINSMERVYSKARVMRFEHFSIEVPVGWKVDDDKKNYTVTFLAPDESAALTVSVMESEGMPLKTWAETLMKELKGKNLARSGRSYTFQFVNEGVSCRAAVAGDKMIVFVTIIGEHKDIEKMIDSMDR